MSDGYLNADEVLFYHPCESDRREVTHDLAWTNEGGNFASAVRGSGFTRDNAGEGVLRTPASAYGSPSGDSSWTWASWLKEPDGYGQFVYAGWFGAGFDPRNALGLYFLSPNKFLGKLATQGGTVSFSAMPTNPLVGSGFVVVRVEFGATVSSGWISFNGSGWVSLGTANREPPDAAGSGLAIVKRRDASVLNRAVIDEMIFWRNTARFTDEELQNLHDLHTVHNRPMDEYWAAYGPAFGSGAELFISGRASGSDAVGLYIGGHAPAPGTGAPLWAYGHAVGSGASALHVRGYADADETAPLAVRGHLPTAADHPLFAGGHGLANASAPLFFPGKSAEADVPLHLHGITVGAGTADLFLRGPTGSCGAAAPLCVAGHGLAPAAAPLFVLSIGKAAGAIALQLGGALAASGEAALFQHGAGPVACERPAPLTLHGRSAWDESAGLVVQGPRQCSGEALLHLENRWCAVDQPLFLYNQQAIGACPLSIRGNEQHHASGFVRVWHDRPKRSANLFIRGQPVGEFGTIHFHAQSAPFHLINVDQPYGVSGAYGGFVRVAWAPYIERASASWCAWVRADGSVDDEAALFVYGHASGSVPQAVGIPHREECSFWIEGAGDVFSAGYTRFSSPDFVAWVHAQPGAEATCPFTLLNIQGTGWASLSVVGIEGIPADTSPLSATGSDATARAVPLSMLGISGRSSGHIPFHCAASDTGVLAGGATLYAHGY